MRPHIEMAVKSNIKTIRGHIRPYKVTCGKQYNWISQCATKSTFFVALYNFCSIWNIFHAKKKKKKNNNNNKASFRTFARCSRSKIKIQFSLFLFQIFSHSDHSTLPVGQEARNYSIVSSTTSPKLYNNLRIPKISVEQISIDNLSFYDEAFI